MKRKLILFLSKYNQPGKIAIASTLAWLSKSKNYLFDNYYDCYHRGIHFGGGDPRKLQEGQLSGGTVSGDRHFEELYFLLHNFDTLVVSMGETLFSACLSNFKIPVISGSGPIDVLYKKIFNFFGVPLPLNIVMTGSNYKKALSGLEAYMYPEIYYREAIGVPDSIPLEELADLYGKENKIFCLFSNRDMIELLKNEGYNVEVIDELTEDDSYLSITERLANRWQESAKGWIIGDPMLVTHWLPKACEEGLLAVYSIPQEKIIAQLGDLISSKGKVVYGRQYSDRDFFELSKLNQCLQVIDPYRPPFQSIKHMEYGWNADHAKGGFYDYEYSDEQLRQFAREKRVLISLMFWSGMIREVANFYNLMDLFAITGLRCGLVLTAQSFEYMMHPPLELLVVPFQQGGVYPNVEPVLGSCGVGVGIESYFSSTRLQEDLKDAISSIKRKVSEDILLPRGWWVTMDSDLERLSWRRIPRFIRLLRYPPYFQIRFNKKDQKHVEDPRFVDKRIDGSLKAKYFEKLKKKLEKGGLIKFFEPYRPYEFYRAGPMRKDVIHTAKSIGFEYMFTKAGFNLSPEIKYVDEDFIALNYTAGHWDGWTPFETINDVSDLRAKEKRLLRRKKPGWIVSTIDSCLWTFSGEIWNNGKKLYEIAQFCSNGGHSGKLINVKPYTISRYARIIAENCR